MRAAVLADLPAVFRALNPASLASAAPILRMGDASVIDLGRLWSMWQRDGGLLAVGADAAFAALAEGDPSARRTPPWNDPALTRPADDWLSVLVPLGEGKPNEDLI